MKVILKEGFTYKAEFMIKEEAYAKLLSAAETFGKDNASSMLDRYLERQLQKPVVYDRHAMIILKNSTISFETHLPSNFVAIIVSVTDSEVEVGSNHDTYEELINTTLDRVFRCRVDILDFIRSELFAPVIMDKE